MRQRYWIASFVIAFILGLNIVLPLISNKNSIQILQEIQAKQEPIVSTGDDIAQPYDYTYLNPPSNSFGCGLTVIKDINWSYWKDWLNTEFNWTCWKSSSGSTWNDASQYLTVGMNYSDENHTAKVSLILNTAGADANYYYKFILGCNDTLRDMFNQTNVWQYDLTLPCNDTEDYNVSFNFSDFKPLIQAGVITVSSGTTDNKFWCAVKTVTRMQPNTIHTIDPNFGYGSVGGSSANCGNYQAYGSNFTLSEYGSTNNITVYLAPTTYTSQTFKVAIYRHSDLSLVAVSGAISLANTNAEWRTAPITASLVPDDYVLMVMSNILPIDYCNVKYTVGFTNQGYNKNIGSYTYPSTLSSPTLSTNKLSIYCNYTRNTSLSYPIPDNASTGISLTPRCNITATFPEGTSGNLFWYTNETGSWVWHQTNSSISNGSYSYVYTGASSNSQQYWWMVSLNDTYTNLSAIYSFTTVAGGVTQTWNTVSTFNGTIYNNSLWHNLQSWNGTLYNTSLYHTISLWNGSIFNTSHWNRLSLFNGSIFNTSLYHTLSSWNGSIYNITSYSWQQLSKWNGTVYNTSLIHSISLFNGTLYNTSLWHNIKSWNGTIYNSSSYKSISLWNGSVFNSSLWKSVSTWNGSIYNTSINVWNTISTWNGSIFNSSSYKQLSKWNGTIYNSSSWYQISKWNGTIYNASQWKQLSLWNGSIYNITAPLSWQQLSKWNGSIFNTTIINYSGANTFAQSTSRIVITSTGYETPQAQYLSDLITPCPLIVSARTITTTDASPVLFTYFLRPLDNISFWGDKFYVDCYSFINTTNLSAIISFPVIYLDGTTGTQTVNITGNGTYNIASTIQYAVKNCTKYQVTQFVGTGSFIIRINQSRYGAIWKIGTNMYGYDGCIIVLGTASAFCNFTIYNTDILFFIEPTCQFYDRTTGYTYVFISTSSYVNITIKNSHITFNYTNNYSGAYLMAVAAASGLSYIEITNSIIVAKSYNVTTMAYVNFPRNASCSDTVPMFINSSMFVNFPFTIGTFYLNDVTFKDVTSFAFFSVNVPYSDSVFIWNCSYGIMGNAYNFFYNVSTIKDCPYFFRAASFYKNGTFVDDVFTNASTTVAPDSTWDGGTILIKYSTKLRVLNDTKQNFSGVNVTILNQTFSTVLSTTTDANGQIPTQILIAKNWTSNTPKITTTYYILLNSSGYQDINYSFQLNEPMNITLMMQNVTSGITISITSMFIVGITAGLLVSSVLIDRRKRKK